MTNNAVPPYQQVSGFIFHLERIPGSWNKVGNNAGLCDTLLDVRDAAHLSLAGNYHLTAISDERLNPHQVWRLNLRLILFR